MHKQNSKITKKRCSNKVVVMISRINKKPSNLIDSLLVLITQTPLLSSYKINLGCMDNRGAWIIEDRIRVVPLYCNKQTNMLVFSSYI